MTGDDELRPMAVYRRLMGYTRPHWRVFIVSAIAMAGSAATESAFMYLMKPLLDAGFVNPDPDVIRWLPWAIVGLFLLRGVTSFAASYGMSWIGRQVVMTVRGELFDHLLVLPSAFYERTSSGHLIARLTFHCEQVAEAATSAFTSIVKDGLTVIGLLGVMFWVDWRLALFALIVAPLIAVIIRYVSKRFRRVSRRLQENVGFVTQAAEEAIAGQRVVKVHNAQAQESKRFAAVNERARWLGMKIVATKAGSDALIQFIAAWAMAALIYVAMRPEMISAITPGDFVAFVGAMLAIMNPLRTLTQVNEKLQRGIAAAHEIFQLIGETPEAAGGERPLGRAEGALRFDAVRFRYRPENDWALDGIDLAIAPGQTVAFVGKTGSGKSTLLSLLPRFQDPVEGAALLDGHDLRDYPLHRLRAQIALVDQQVRLFDATIAENIAYGLNPQPPRDAIEAAARSANAWEFIEPLPQGLDTPVGQNGQMLSGGQRQRIAIARALLRDAPILILDEATSALDTETERMVQGALERLAEGRTTLIIAHRLSTILKADLIVVMQHGRIVEQGRHDELLAANGVYAALYHMQFAKAGDPRA